MASSVLEPPVPRHHKRFETVPVTMAKADLKNLAPWRQQIAQALDYAISLANRTQKEVWAALGHSDGAQLNRWIAGTERPQFDLLFSVEWLRQPLIIALSGLAGDGIEIKTVIEIRRTA